MGDSVQNSEQDKWLADASQNIKKHAFFMKKSLDGGNLREALKYCAAMLGELRTSLLTPQKYYELYMLASSELLQLEMAFQDEVASGRKTYSELYEMVQHAGNILPRLYLMCTVGSVYIKSKEGSAKVILNDLVDLCKGVQHPTRGLFLRSYLAQVSRDKLPDTGSPYEGPEGGNVVDAVDFVVRNFTEMNKLWVRMQHQGAMRDKERRERERQQLQDLIGKNLVLLGQLEGMDLEMYQTMVLPKIIEQVISCKDSIAQQYLMDSMIQAFPDEFHLRTLDILLGACPELQPGVGVHVVMSGLMNRLAKYAKDNSNVASTFNEVDAFRRLCSATQNIAKSRTEMLSADVASLHMALLNFAAEVHPDKLEFIDVVLESCFQVLEPKGKVAERAAEKQLVELLISPLDKLGIMEVLRMPSYPKLMGLLNPSTCQGLSITICRSMLRTNTCMSNLEDLEQFFLLIDLLIQDQPGEGPTEDDEDFKEHQNVVARIIHLLRSDDPDQHMEVITAARTRLLSGGPQRLRHTLRPLCFSGLWIIRRIATASEPRPKTGLQSVYKFLFQTIETLSEVAQQPQAALQLLLQCALSASEVASSDEIAFQFMEAAFEIFEESISDSKAQISALQSIVGTLQRCYAFGRVNREMLASKVTAYSAKLLHKVDQCRALCTCAHLYWQADRPELDGVSYKSTVKANGNRKGDAASKDDDDDGDDDDASDEGSGMAVRDGHGVLKTLKRALKTANTVQQQLSFSKKAAGSEQAAALFVEILNTYVFFYAEGCPQITPKVLQDLIELTVNEIGEDNADPVLQSYLSNTISHIKRQQSKEGELGERFSKLSL